MDVVGHLRFIRYLARRFMVQGYERDDMMQDICLVAHQAPGREGVTGNEERAYLVKVALSRRYTFLRSMAQDKRRCMVEVEDFDALASSTGTKGGQFEHVLLREALTELDDPKPWKGNGNMRRHEAAKLMVDSAVTGEELGSRAKGGKQRQAICELRKRLRDHFSMAA